MVWVTSFPSLLKLIPKEKTLKPDAMIMYKWPAAIYLHMTNYRTLAHRHVVTAETGSSAPCGHCTLCGNFGHHRTSMVNYTEVL